MKFFLKRRTLSFQSYTRTGYHKDQLFILTFRNSKSLLDVFSQKGWIDMCLRFSLIKVHVGGLMKSIAGTHYAVPQKGMQIKVYSLNGAEDSLSHLKNFAAEYDVFISFGAKKVALLGYRIYSEKWKSILFPQSNIVVFSAFETRQLKALCQSQAFTSLQQAMDMEEIGQFSF